MPLFGPYIALFRGKTSIIHGNQWREREDTIYPDRGWGRTTLTLGRIRVRIRKEKRLEQQLKR